MMYVRCHFLVELSSRSKHSSHRNSENNPTIFLTGGANIAVIGRVHKIVGLPMQMAWSGRPAMSFWWLHLLKVRRGVIGLPTISHRKWGPNVLVWICIDEIPIRKCCRTYNILITFLFSWRCYSDGYQKLCTNENVVGLMVWSLVQSLVGVRIQKATKNFAPMRILLVWQFGYRCKV